MGLTPRPERTRFRSLHAGQTAWVLASGASLDHIDPGFFADKLLVAVNWIAVEMGVRADYTCTHYHVDAIAMSEQHPGMTIITPEEDQGGTLLARHAPTSPDVWSFPTNPQMYGAFNVAQHWPTEPDALVVGPTSLHFAMHFAAYLVGPGGSLVLAGADCCRLDGAPHRGGHSPGIGAPWDVWQTSLPAVAGRLRADGVNVYSLNPFVPTWGTEGHSLT